MACIFCELEEERIELENELAVAIYDKYPVNEGHMLIIPRRHYPDFFQATTAEVQAVYRLLGRVKEHLAVEYGAKAFNIGINVGREAGQTIMHLHVHIIPRYPGDVDDPRGGVRNLKEALVPYRG